MALLSRIICKECKRERDVSHSASDAPPEICNECKNNLAQIEKALYLSKLKRLTMEQRLSKIEEWIYEYRPIYSPWSNLIE